MICGQDRSQIGLLIFPVSEFVLNADDDEGAWISELLKDTLSQKLNTMAEHSTGSSTRICRAVVLSAPPSLKDHEITVKGNLNVRKVMDNRSALVDRLYDDNDPATITLS